MTSHTFEDFLTPTSTFYHTKMTVLVGPSCILSQKRQPHPPTCLTSFMDDHILQYTAKNASFQNISTIQVPVKNNNKFVELVVSECYSFQNKQAPYHLFSNQGPGQEKYYQALNPYE